MAVARLDRLVRPLGALALTLAVATVVVGLFVTPEERVLGPSIRILYVHVGAAWTAYLAYGVMALGAVAYLNGRQAIWDRLAAASAELGVVLMTLTLATGMLWARVAQGWWWQWSDARLTLTLLLWLMSIAYVVLRRATEGELRAQLSAVLALITLPAIVLNHFATLLFRSYHPDTILARPDAAAADAPFVGGVALSLAAYTALYAWLVVARMGLDAQRADGASDGSAPDVDAAHPRTGAR
jgi:heme exporter protein C